MRLGRRGRKVSNRGARRPGAVVVAVALLGLVLGVAAETIETPTPAAAGDPEGNFIATTPCRIVDTRSATPASPLAPGASRSYQVGGTTNGYPAQGGADGGCGVPSNAVAVELSFTAISPTGANGFLRAGPAGTTPTGTILNYTVGTGITNTGTVPVSRSSTPSIAVTNFGGTIHLAVDVQGYFVNSSASRYVPVTPCRMSDTRSASPAGPFAANETRVLRVAGSGTENFTSAGVAPQGGVAGGCGVPINATAVEITITAASPEGTGFLRAGPNTVGDPTGTVLNFTSAQGISNTASVAFVGDGLMKVKVFGARTQVLVDVQGYYVPTGAISEFVSVTPCRVVDTRSAVPATPLAAGETRSFGVTGNALSGQGGSVSCAVPSNAAAVEVSITAAAPVGNGFLRVWPSDNPEPPATILNYSGGRGITNTATVALSRGAFDQLSVRNFGGSTHVILDVQGYFTAPRAAEQLTVGNGFGCALVGSGDVFCWGANSSGQVGSGSESLGPVLQPRQFAGALTATRVSAGSSHACLLTSTSGVACWGSNFVGQLGIGPSPGNTATPTELTSPDIVNITAVSTGSQHTCAVRGDGTVWCWGDNSVGQLGDGTTAGSSTPVQVAGVADAAQVVAGFAHTCARSLGGTVRCWGSNGAAQLGDGTFTDSSVPVVVSGLPPSSNLAAGGFASCSVDAGGAVRCWGLNTSGQLGNGTIGGLSSVPVQASISSVSPSSTALAGGPAGFCAVQELGDLLCWGDGRTFGFADGGVAPRATPSLLRSRVASVAMGGTFDSGAVCAIDLDGGVRCWGITSPFGDGAATGNPFSNSAATPAPGPAVPAGSTVALSEWFPAGWGCALGGGAVQCWGNNQSGQLGDGTLVAHLAPAPVVGLGGTPTQVSAGGDHACAVVGGGVRCWGGGESGELGDGAAFTSASPVSVSGLSGGVTQVAASNGTTCALVAPAGTVQCWGAGTDGQLGNGTTTPAQTTPVPVTGLSGVTQLTAGTNHFCAVTGGQVRCWGFGTDGQLGQGVAVSSSTPVAVAGLSGVSRVAAGFNHTCAQLTSGGVRCWGNNSFGQLGDGTTLPRLSPVAVSGLSGASSLSVSGEQSCAVTGGTARCWGLNRVSQLGDGTAADRSTPTTVSGLTGVVAVEVGYESACARLSDGSQRCWGSRTSGGIGSAPVSATPRPLQQFGF